MSEARPIRLSWDYWVYQLSAISVFILTLGIGGVYLLTDQTMTAWGFVGLLGVFNGVTMMIIIVSCRRLQEGADFSVFKLINIGATDNAPPLRIHRYLLGTILLMIALMSQGVPPLIPDPTLAKYVRYGTWMILALSFGITAWGHSLTTPSNSELKSP